MSDIDFFQIGALKVFAELGALIEEDERNKTKFSDIPYDIIKIIKNHVTILKIMKKNIIFIIKLLQNWEKNLSNNFIEEKGLLMI